jgi:hypothetical protein
VSRRRVTLRQSFREAWEASNAPGSADTQGYGAIIVAVWYWIVGVPERDTDAAD